MALQRKVLTAKDLEGVSTLRDMQLPAGELVMMIRRNGKYIVPNGKVKLQPGDALLLVKETNENQ